MAHDVFLSYSSKDRLTADAACHYLEHNNVRVWMAPRDILPSMSWAASIVQAINAARVMVLIVSSNAITSPQIEREVERAINKGVPVLPFRVEDVSLNDALEYFLSAPHWLDAFDPPLERHLESLTMAVWQLLQTDYVQREHSEAAAAAPPPTGGGRAAQQHPEAVAVVQLAVETATHPPPPPSRPEERGPAQPDPQPSSARQAAGTAAEPEVRRGAGSTTAPRTLRAPKAPNARGAFFMTKGQRRTVLRLLLVPAAIVLIATSIYGYILYRRATQAQAMARMQTLVKDASTRWRQGATSGLLVPDAEGARYDRDLTEQSPAFLMGAIAAVYAQDDGPDCGPDKISVSVTQATCNWPTGGSLVVRSNLMPELLHHPPKTVYGPSGRPLDKGVEPEDYKLVNYMNRDLGYLDVDYRVGVASKADRQVIHLLVDTLTQLHDLDARIQTRKTPSMVLFGRRTESFQTLNYQGWVGGNEKLGIAGCVVTYSERPGQFTTFSLVCYQSSR